MSYIKDSLEVKSGDLGEDIVEEYFLKKGFIRLQKHEERSHGYDFMFKKNDKKFIVEVKTKPKRVKYNDTGFDLHSYKNYKRIQNKKNIKVFNAFVDFKLKQIYGNWLDILNDNKGDNELCSKYPIIDFDNNLVFFDLNKMIVLCELNNNQIEQLKKYSKMNKKYKYEWQKNIAK